VLCPLLHEYEYGETPPVVVTFIAPLVPPTHGTLMIEADCTRSLGAVIVAELLAVQLFASVTVMV
jgi:hypothetical protein